MGESSRRGTKEERVAKALDVKKQKIDAIKQQLGLPENAEFLGYLVQLAKNDEFILAIEETPEVVRRSATKVVGEALRFTRYWDAHKYTREEKGERVVGLFDLDGQLLIKPVL